MQNELKDMDIDSMLAELLSIHKQYVKGERFESLLCYEHDGAVYKIKMGWNSGATPTVGVSRQINNHAEVMAIIDLTHDSIIDNWDDAHYLFLVIAAYKAENNFVEINSMLSNYYEGSSTHLVGGKLYAA